MSKKKSTQAEKLSFRLAPHYAEIVLKAASAAGITPNQFGRIATMAIAQNGFLPLNESIGRVEEEVIRLRKDFNDALRDE